MRNQYIGRSTVKNTNEPLTGYKCTMLTLVRDQSGNESIFLAPIQAPNKSMRIGFNDVSHCKMFRWHRGKPGSFCDCGFYAYTEVINAIKHTFRNNLAIVKTVASGKVLLYDKGVRSGYQRVTDVFIQRCDRPTCMAYSDRIALFDDGSNEFEIAGVCPLHAHGMNCRTFSWLQETINSGFTRGEPEVKVRSIKKSSIPWDGQDSSKVSQAVRKEKKSTLIWERKITQV